MEPLLIVKIQIPPTPSNALGKFFLSVILALDGFQEMEGELIYGTDTWLSQSLRSQIYGPLPPYEDIRKVSSIIRIGPNTNYWNPVVLPFSLPQNIYLEIMSQPLPLEITHKMTQCPEN